MKKSIERKSAVIKRNKKKRKKAVKERGKCTNYKLLQLRKKGKKLMRSGIKNIGKE